MPITERKSPDPIDLSWNGSILWNSASSTDKGIINTWNKSIKGFELNTKWLLNNETIIKKYIDDKYTNAGTRRNHYRVYTTLIKNTADKETLDRWGKLWKDQTEKINQISGQSVFTGSRLENFITETEINNKTKELYEAWMSDLYNNKLNLQHLMLCLYTLQPPIRGEWFNMMIWEEAVSPPISYGEILINDNYLFRKTPADKWKILINNDKKMSIDYNTHKTYKGIVLELDTELWRKISGSKFTLNEIINKSLEYYPRKYVLSSITLPEAPLAEGFRRQMSYIFGKSVGVDILRQAYVNHIAHNMDLSYNDREKVATNMRHSILTSEMQYKKLKSQIII